MIAIHEARIFFVVLLLLNSLQKEGEQVVGFMHPKFKPLHAPSLLILGNKWFICAAKNKSQIRDLRKICWNYEQDLGLQCLI